MKKLFITYSLLTLAKSIRYIDEFYDRNDCTIIYASFQNEISDELKKEYIIIHIDGSGHKFSGLKRVYSDNIIAKNSYQAIKESDFSKLEEVFVFRDNEVLECYLITKIINKLEGKIKITLVEEGTAFYTTDRLRPKHIFVRKVIGFLMGVPFTEEMAIPQGYNNIVNKFICSDPQKIKMIKDRNGLEVEQEINVFTDDFCNYFLSLLGYHKQKQSKYDYIFLTQPAYEMLKYVEENEKIYDAFFDEFVHVLPEHKKVLIKLHPRDSFNYDKFIRNGKVEVASGIENEAPFECLYGVFGRPQLITFYSSACFNLTGEKPNLFLYKLLGLQGIKGLDNELFIQHGIVCENFIELKKQLNIND